MRRTLRAMPAGCQRADMPMRDMGSHRPPQYTKMRYEQHRRNIAAIAQVYVRFPGGKLSMLLMHVVSLGLRAPPGLWPTIDRRFSRRQIRSHSHPCIAAFMRRYLPFCAGISLSMAWHIPCVLRGPSRPFHGLSAAGLAASQALCRALSCWRTYAITLPNGRRKRKKYLTLRSPSDAG
jgi:hypothetical protein